VIAVVDLGMYTAKTQGRNRAIGVITAERMQTPSDVQALLEQGLDQALGRALVTIVK
jgi:hypothetical protein